MTAAPLEDAIAHLQSCGVTPLDEPMERTGVIGSLCSIYFRNPDGNLIELSNQIRT